MYLMSGESILHESQFEAGSLILTTHRVRYQTESFGYSQIQSIMLEELSYCALISTSSPGLLVLAVICTLVGFLAGFAAIVNTNEPAHLVLGIAGGIMFGGLFALLYFASRRRILYLASAGGRIDVPTKSIKAENLRGFIDAAEAAKNARYLLR
jgi:hypothetical protein